MIGDQTQLTTPPHIPPTSERARYAELLRFYIPLAIQAASQSLTYPLVAAVASRGPGGPLNLAGLAQSNAIMFVLGTLASGLVTTGMVYANTKAGYARFHRLTLLVTAAIVLLQAILCLPPIAHLWFHQIMGLPASIEHPAYQSLVASLVLQLLFNLRLPYQACLYGHGATNLANNATLLRIFSTVVLIPIFISLGLVGPIWAVIVQAIPVAGEWWLSRHFALPFAHALPDSSTEPPTVRELFAFTMPLSVGGLFLSVSGVVIAGIMAKAPDPERMLQAYYLASGLAGPAAYAASRVQPVALTFIPRMPRGRTIFNFSLMMGLFMGCIPLLFIIPGLADVYYMTVQKCPQDIFPLVRISAIWLLFHPLTMAFRAYHEGKAALLKKPIAVLTGQAVFFGVLTGVALFCIQLGVPGNLLAPIGYLAANIIAGLMVHYAITWGERIR